ncbi:MAG: hypothetical protein WKG07_46505 [Hymenobacter sp.]
MRIAYMDVAAQGTPNGHTVMIFHGHNFAGFYFGNIIDALRAEGFRVIVVDQIGYGRSSKPIIPSLERHGSELERHPAEPEDRQGDGSRPLDGRDAGGALRIALPSSHRTAVDLQPNRTG